MLRFMLRPDLSPWEIPAGTHSIKRWLDLCWSGRGDEEKNSTLDGGRTEVIALLTEDELGEACSTHGRH